MKQVFLAFVGFALLGLGACTPVGMVITAGTTAGTFAMEERGLEGAATDLNLKAQIVNNLFQTDINLITELSVIVYNQKAMIVGTLENEDDRAQAIRQVWMVEGVTDVFNEIRIKSADSLENFAHDTWIDTKLLAKVTFDGQLMDINYKFETDAGIVHVIGLAQNNGELNRFIAHAKSISYVKRIVSHVEVKPQKSMFRENPDRKGGLVEYDTQPSATQKNRETVQPRTW